MIFSLENFSTLHYRKLAKATLGKQEVIDTRKYGC